jgi:Putative peptidoglycan binding domain
MLTYAQLRAEQVWRDQIEPPELKRLRVDLEKYFDPSKTNIGTMGDNRHVRGYHRSRNWIVGSRFCRDRSYSTTETEGNRVGGDGDWVSAIDLVIGEARARAVAHRVDIARGRGQIRYVREILLERDPWHVHLSLDRAYANSNHDQLFRVITGVEPVGSAQVDVTVKMPVLKRGSQGGHVHTAQCLLVARGFATANDGDFGPDTYGKTMAMQKRYGAERVDGVWGPETWAIAISGEDRV